MPASGSTLTVERPVYAAVNEVSLLAVPKPTSSSHSTELAISQPEIYLLEYAHLLPEHVAEDKTHNEWHFTQHPWISMTGIHATTAPPGSFSDLDSFIFRQPTLKAPKAFQVRKLRHREFSLNRNYVLSTLRSYPSMLLGSKPPPFIHPESMVDISTGNKNLPGPLAACAVLVRWFLVKDKSNDIFIWNCIRMEQEKLDAQCAQYDDQNTIAALQAITIYFLLRLSVDNDEATTFDVPLIQTMIKLASQVNRVRSQVASTSEGTTPAWSSWILGEAACRTIITLFIVDFICDISSVINYECDAKSMSRMALPSSRSLWEASTEVEWNKLYTTRDEKQLTNGDLLKSRFKSDTLLDSWLEQLDGFGTLVMAAASLVQ